MDRGRKVIEDCFTELVAIKDHKFIKDKSILETCSFYRKQLPPQIDFNANTTFAPMDVETFKPSSVTIELIKDELNPHVHNKLDCNLPTLHPSPIVSVRNNSSSSISSSSQTIVSSPVPEEISFPRSEPAQDPTSQTVDIAPSRQTGLSSPEHDMGAFISPEQSYSSTKVTDDSPQEFRVICSDVHAPPCPDSICPFSSQTTSSTQQVQDKSTPSGMSRNSITYNIPRIYLLVVDVGIKNLGLVYGSCNPNFSDPRIEDFALVDITRSNSEPRDPLFNSNYISDRVQRMAQEYNEWFSNALMICIEAQPPNGFQSVEEVLFLLFRPKAYKIYPNSMKKRFGFSGAYEERKEQASKKGRELLQEYKNEPGLVERYDSMPRNHDVGEGICYFIMHNERIRTPLESLTEEQYPADGQYETFHALEQSRKRKNNRGGESQKATKKHIEQLQGNITVHEGIVVEDLMEFM
jgi:hypothetical protein